MLYTFWRSSAAYRVRVALSLKGVERKDIRVHLRRDGGQQRQRVYLNRNPQGLVPMWQEGDWCLSQSLAIIEYIEDRWPQPPLLPRQARARAEVRALAQIIACDIHPLNNLRVLQYLRGPLALEEDTVLVWIRHWIGLGFDALEARLANTGGNCCYGDALTLADVCLVPQVYSAERFDFSLESYPCLSRITAHLRGIDAFRAAAPEQQPDAEL